LCSFEHVSCYYYYYYLKKSRQTRDRQMNTNVKIKTNRPTKIYKLQRGSLHKEAQLGLIAVLYIRPKIQ